MQTIRSHRGSKKRSVSRLPRWLEPLEARTLLSAVISLIGNSHTIANGESTPTLTDFTSYGDMSTTPTGAIGTVTRTYQIANLGDADLNLTGSSMLVAISGVDAADFFVSSDASTSVIGVGNSANFTISFVPQDTGLRQAVVTIESDDPNVPSFSFDIAGNGLATTDSQDGLQVATTVSGTGSAAISGSAITIDYSGYLTTGTIFDSTDPSIMAGRTPFNLVLGRGSSIAGWEEGLLGIQAGESRTLIIPSSLAFGFGGTITVPPNAPVIYTFTALSVTQPTISLTGNGHTIDNGESAPSTTDFTDFGNMTTTGTLGPMTRSFVITDSSIADLNLTGDPDLISISGANAGDFAVTVSPSTTIASGHTTTFTISFSPQAEGLREAVISIPSTDPDNPVFTFNIQGTGVATTDSQDGLQVITNTAGSGSVAMKGSDLVVNYTGYLMNGTIFDSSDPTINAGRTPFEVVLGRNSVIQGWEQGLLGIQPGETRTLYIPASLAYGSAGQGNIPPNANLIFTVTAVSVGQPTIAVAGNTQSITNGDTTPLISDFTDFGPMSVSNTLGTVTRTFVISDATGADLYLTGDPTLVSITGADAGDFAVTVNPNTTVTAGGSASFTISFTPLATGLRQATVTIPSSDPDQPSFTFDIQGTGLTTTNSSNGLMIATTTVGTGLAAVTGSRVGLTLTGTLYNGTVFTSATDSNASLSLVLGDPSTVTGLNQGLLGIQPGETRTIIVPSALGFGSNANGSIPANSPLIYTVTAQSVQAPAVTMTVSGNGTNITNGDTTPSATDFTDFGPMSTSQSSSIGLMTRTYVISDIGGLDLVLSGGIKAISITGANKGDFSVVGRPLTYVTAFGQTSFTIAFAPHGTGLRKGVVTIISNDPNTPSFSFSIQGTGVNTKNDKSGLQVSTSGSGTGVRAIVGADLTVNYTGTLLDGTVFDSSLTQGRSPLEFNLGLGEVISGWDQALLNARAGQSIVLVIPASLAYGNAGSTNIPPNSPLIFTISVLTVTNPSIRVSGNGVPITLGDHTPSAVDATAISTVAGSSSAVTATFTIYSGNAGITTFPKSPAVDVPNRFASNFSVSTVTNSSTSSTFTVTFTPTVVGTKTAPIRIHTADPAHPLFTFTVSGTFTSFVDLQAASIGTIKYPFPGQVISGETTKYAVPVTVANLGNISVPGNTAPVSFVFSLHNLVTNTDTVISTQTSTALRGLGKGKTKLVSFNVPIPISIPTGNYEMKVLIDNNSASQNTNLTNDTALSTQAVPVTQGFYNVDGVLTTSTLPATVIAGQSLPGKFSVLVENSGNLKLPSGQTFTLQVVARPTTGADFVLKNTTVSVGSLSPGQSTGITVSNFNPGLTAGQYQLLAILTPVQTLTETSVADNVARTTALGGTLTLTVL